MTEIRKKNSAYSQDLDKVEYMTSKVDGFQELGVLIYEQRSQ